MTEKFDALCHSLIGSLDGQLNSFINSRGEIDVDRWRDRYPPQNLPPSTPCHSGMQWAYAPSVRVRGDGLNMPLHWPLAMFFIMNRNNSGQQTTTCQHAQILYVYKVIHETSSLPVAHKSSHDLYHTETLVYLTQKWIGKRAVFITNFLFTINQPRVIWE